MALYGSRYRLVERLGPADTVSPLALATVRIAVGDLLRSDREPTSGG